MTHAGAKIWDIRGEANVHLGRMEREAGAVLGGG